MHSESVRMFLVFSCGLRLVYLASCVLIVATGPLLAWLERTYDLTCEADPLWQGVKRRLLFELRKVEEIGHMDLSRSLNIITSGVKPDDLQRCEIGAAAVQLLMHTTALIQNPDGFVGSLTKSSWSEISTEPWYELSQVLWPVVLGSTWPIFGILTLMRDVLLKAGLAQLNSSCEALWDALQDEERAHLTNPSDTARAVAIGLKLSSADCSVARATAFLATLVSMPTLYSEIARNSFTKRAQDSAYSNWASGFLFTRWPALPLLQTVERHALPESIQANAFRQLRGAVAYINFQPVETPDTLRLQEIESSIASVEKHWFSEMGASWPIFVFADPNSSAMQAVALHGRFPLLDIRIVQIPDFHLKLPMHNHSLCSEGYRRMARYKSGPLYTHEALNATTHLLVIDTDFQLTHRVPRDPLDDLYRKQSKLAYWQLHSEGTWDRTSYLTEISQEFMKYVGLQVQIPELVQYWWDHDEEGNGGSLPVNVYACLYAGDMSFFRSHLFQSYFQELDSWGGWDAYCWSPQNVLAIAAAFFLNQAEFIELWVFGSHQQSSKLP